MTGFDPVSEETAPPTEPLPLLPENTHLLRKGKYKQICL